MHLIRMGRLSALAILLAATICVSIVLARPQASAGPHKPVIVELFTSEGCSSCPPADELLGHLSRDLADKNIQVIPLGLHVDYWNSLGWKDRFSTADFSHRQEQYARSLGLDGPYTPQMVVDGTKEFVGNDANEAQREISQAASQPAIAEVNISVTGNEKLSVQVKAPAATSADVLLAITEDNLSTKVGGGENGGRVLHHAAVVRELRQLGPLRNGGFESSAQLNLGKDWKRDDLHAVVFVQEGSSGRIQGAASVALVRQPR